jgi:hypothetical protein
MIAAKELQIVKELGSVCILYALVLLGIKMDIVGTIPQWITAAVAFLALVAAYRSIESQREIARKRAAMDFFTKTDMDSQYAGATQKLQDGVRETGRAFEGK